MHHRAAHGFTLIEIMIVVAIVALLSAVAIPSVTRGRTSANESAAVGNLRALIGGMEMFRIAHPAYPQTDTFQATLYTSADPDYGPPSFDLDLSIAQTVQGYDYTYAYTYAARPGGCTDAASNCTGYTLNAVATMLGRTGVRSLVADETGYIRHCTATAQGQTADPAGAGEDNLIGDSASNCD